MKKLYHSAIQSKWVEAMRLTLVFAAVLTVVVSASFGIAHAQDASVDQLALEVNQTKVKTNDNNSRIQALETKDVVHEKELILQLEKIDGNVKKHQVKDILDVVQDTKLKEALEHRKVIELKQVADKLIIDDNKVKIEAAVLERVDIKKKQVDNKLIIDDNKAKTDTAILEREVLKSKDIELQAEASVTKSKADQNESDIQNLKGGLPVEVEARIAADSDLQSQIDNIELVPGPPGPQGPQGPIGPEGQGQTINLTIDPTQFPGIEAQDFNALFPDAVLNMATLEMSDLGTSCKVIVINGPATEIQVVEGYGGTGNHFDHSGLSQELPFVIEIPPSADCHDELLLYFDSYVDYPSAISLIVKNSENAESFRWNFSDFEPAGYTAGLEGTRFNFTQKNIPDNTNHIAKNPEYGSNVYSNNPLTDKLLEVSGRPSVFPAVIEEAERSLILVYDYVEGNDVWVWMKEVVEYGTTTSSLLKNDVSVVTLDGDGGEISRDYYYGCFPKKYEQYTGFTQDIQTKARVILNCDYRVLGESGT